MTQFIEPNKKSDLTFDNVLTWLSVQRTGLVSGFAVTAGSSAFLVNIASGTVAVKGTIVFDDETRGDVSGLLSAPTGSNDDHWIMYVTYTAVDTFPPAAMTFGAVRTSAVAPVKPATPTLPPDSVKIADIFVPNGATSLTSAGVVIVNAQPIPALGADGADALIERLTRSNMNTVFSGGGSITYNGSTTLTWTDPFDIVAEVTSGREVYKSAPLTAARIAAGSLGPSPVVGPDSLLFTVVDRRVPTPDITVPVAATMRVVNFAAPSTTELNAFFDPTTRDNVIVLGVLTGGVLRLRGGIGPVIPAAVGDTLAYLQNDPGGNHTWEHILSAHIDGALVAAGSVLPQISAATAQAQLASLHGSVNSEFRGSATGVDTMLPSGVLGGGAWGVTAPSTSQARRFQREFSQFGVGVKSTADTTTGALNACLVTTTGGLGLSIDTGEFFTRYGTFVAITTPLTLNAPGSDGQFVVKYDPVANTFSANTTSIDEDQFPLAVIDVSGGGTTATIVADVRRRCVGPDIPKHVLTLGTRTTRGRGAMFDDLKSAVYHIACFDSASDIEPMEIWVQSTISNNSPVDGTEAFLAARLATRLNGLRVIGKPASDDPSQPAIGWATADTPLVHFGNGNNCENVAFENVNMFWNGAAVGNGAGSNPDQVFFKNPGRGFRLSECRLNGNVNGVSAFINWSNSSVGGFSSTVSRNYPALFERCQFVNMTGTTALATGKVSFFNVGLATIANGLLAFRDCHFHSPAAARVDHLVDIVNGALFSVTIDNCKIEGLDTSVFRHVDGSGNNIPFSTAPKRISKTSFVDNAAGIRLGADTSSPAAQVSCDACEFAHDIDLAGGHLISGCWGSNGAVITASATVSLGDCEFGSASSVTGTMPLRTDGCRLAIGGNAFLSTESNVTHILSDTIINKAVSPTAKAISISDSSSILASNIEISVSGGSTDTGSLIIFTGNDSVVEMSNLKIGALTTEGHIISLTGTGHRVVISQADVTISSNSGNVSSFANSSSGSSQIILNSIRVQSISNTVPVINLTGGTHIVRVADSRIEPTAGSASSYVNRKGDSVVIGCRLFGTISAGDPIGTIGGTSQIAVFKGNHVTSSAGNARILANAVYCIVTDNILDGGSELIHIAGDLAAAGDGICLRGVLVNNITQGASNLNSATDARILNPNI